MTYEDRAETIQLFEREEVGFWQEGHVFGHAVHAAEIAPVGDGYAEVGDCASERIDQFPTGQTVSETIPAR
jgi:hypothetical protein